MASPVGLTLLAQGASSADQGVDIIAIHGLGDNTCWETWTTNHPSRDKGQAVFWLRDFLPTDLALARIFTYNYRSSTSRDSWGIVDAADKLLNDLKSLRADKAEVGLSTF